MQSDTIQSLKDSVKQVCLQSERNPESVQIVAVSKTKPVSAIRDAYKFGFHKIGENKIQEAESKIVACSDLDIEWHLIGHLQSNKAKKAVALFDLIHSVDSVKLIHKLNEESKKIQKVQRILLQINISGEESKFGADSEQTDSLMQSVLGCKHLQCEGFMTIPPQTDDPENTRSVFRKMKELADQYRNDIVKDNREMQLSMGMSSDYPLAIQEGATLVRIGTAIFGKRNDP